MKRFLSISFLTSIIAVLTLSSCHHFGSERIRGNGVLKTETRNLANFNGIDVGGAYEVYVRQDSMFSVKVEADENLLPYIEIYVENGILNIETKDNVNLRPTRDTKIYVSGPSFTDFRISGASDINSENKLTSDKKISFDLSGASKIQVELAAPAVDVRSSGAGNVSLKGETKELYIDGSGSTDVRCFDLLAENVKVELTGSGNAQVFASVKLDIEVSGAGDVRYRGNPAVSQSISGAGSVRKEN